MNRTNHNSDIWLADKIFVVIGEDKEFARRRLRSKILLQQNNFFRHKSHKIYYLCSVF